MKWLTAVPIPEWLMPYLPLVQVMALALWLIGYLLLMLVRETLRPYWGRR